MKIGKCFWVTLLCAAFAVPVAACSRSSKPDMKAVDAFLKDIVQKHGGGKIEVDPTPLKSTFGNVAIVRFYIESGGNKIPGLAFIADKQVLVGGTLLEMPDGKNLSQEIAGKPIPIVLNMDQFDLSQSVPRGPKNAKTVVIEFSDFECPFCRREAAIVENLMKKYPGQIVLYYKHFPLENIHPLADKMAVAAECAKAQRPESFWTFHDHFFTDGEIRSLDEVRSRGRAWARADGLNEAKWLSCYDKDVPTPFIQKDAQEGKKIGISGTPAFVINGRMVVGAVPIEELEAAIAGKEASAGDKKTK